jgi:glycosyltransferase involved in cell wall biosynthesis
MRVLLFSQYFWPESFLINDLVPLLRKRGVDVTVFTAKPNYPDGKIYEGYRALGTEVEQHEGVTILRVPVFPRGTGSRVRLAANYLSFIFSALIFGPSLLRGRNFDLVFVFAVSPLLQALSAIRFANGWKVPLVIWVQDLWPESLSATGTVKSRWILNLVGQAVRFIYRSSDRILVQSRAFVAPVLEFAHDRSKIYFYPNFYQTNEAAVASERAAELAKTFDDHFCVVFAGNLGAAQALDTVLDVARKLQDHTQIRFVLVGSGSLSGWLTEQKERYKLDNVVLPGRFEPSDMQAILGAAGALLMSLRPDLAFEMTIPSKLQAYMAMGRPILAALDGEGARIVEEAGAGYCSPAGDAEALRKNILRMAAAHQEEKDRMGRAGRDYFDRNFAPDTVADQLVQHFNEVLVGKEQKA